jgi:hypothetical protein
VSTPVYTAHDDTHTLTYREVTPTQSAHERRQYEAEEEREEQVVRVLSRGRVCVRERDRARNQDVVAHTITHTTWNRIMASALRSEMSARPI